MTQPAFRVVSGLLERDGRYLCQVRPAGKLNAGKVEIPGGKIEPGEGARDALKREWLEETGSSVEVEHDRRCTVDAEDTDGRPFEAILYRVRLVAGSPEPQPLQASGLLWLNVAEILTKGRAGETSPAMPHFWRSHRSWGLRTEWPSAGTPWPLLVGELNPYVGDPVNALLDEPAGSSGERMRRLICRMRSETYQQLRRVNLCHGKWSVEEAQKSVDRLLSDRPQGPFVLLGQKVAQAFCLRYLPFSHVVIPGSNALATILPPPSGRNGLWGVEGNLDLAYRVLWERFPAVPFGEVQLHE